MSDSIKKLGKIKDITFGIGGYQDAMLGYHINFSLEGGSKSISISKGTFDYNRVKHQEYSTWNEEDRDESMLIMLKDLSNVLSKAKVNTVDKLVNMPVEVTIKDNIVKDWRILEEVL